MENSGPVNFSPELRAQRQGILGSVSLDDIRLTDWKIYPVPLDHVNCSRHAVTAGRVVPENLLSSSPILDMMGR